MEELDDTGISLLPFGKFPTMLVVSDSVGFTSDSPLTYDMTAAFPVAREGRPPQTMRFSEFYTRPGCTPVNASPERLPVQTHHSGPKLMANLYFVRLFHSLLSNDFADAPCSCSCSCSCSCYRGRDGHFWPPPAQIRTCRTTAYGSYL